VTLSLPDATISSSYNAPLAVSGGTPDYTWSITAGALPAGLTLSSTAGVISGIPTALGTATVTIQVQDATAQSASRQFTLTVSPQPLAITIPGLPDVNAGASYSVTMTGSGGVTPYNWTIFSGALPQGLSMTTAGVISGTPTATGQFTFTVRLKDATNATVNRDFTINVVPIFRITSLSVWGGIQGQPHSQILTTADGTNPITWSVTSGTLPPGISLVSNTGELTGTPTTTGTYTFTIQAADGFARLATLPFSMIISSSSATYGNSLSDVYATEGGGPDPAAIVLNACQTAALTTNGSYRLGQSVTVPAGTAGQNCFLLGSGVKLDLAGFTITGRLNRNGNANGIVVFNGTINCNWPDNGSDAGCVRITSTTATSTVQLRIHHLTVTNTGNATRSIHVDWPLTSKPTITSIRIFNNTMLVPTQPTVSRSFAVSVVGTNHTVEMFSNDVTCVADANACQALVCFRAASCKFHHNRADMLFNTTSERGRALLFDGSVQSGEAWNNLIIANNNRAVRIRDSFNIRVHHNQIKNIQNNGAGTIHLADPDAGAVNDLRTLVDENDFELADGIVLFVRNGFNVTARNNRFSCSGNCSLSKFAIVRTPLSPGTRSELTLENNPNVILYMAPPQVTVDLGGTLNICNSGQAGGNGTIIPTACVP
jgi:hypothetical protein